MKPREKEISNRITQELYYEQKDILKTVQGCDITQFPVARQKYLKNCKDFIEQYETGHIKQWYEFYKR